MARRSESDADFESMARALAQAPNDWQLHLRYGVLLHRAGRAAEAIAPLRRAVELSGSTFETCSELGMALVNAGDPVAAEPWLRRVVQIAPQFAGGHSNLGLCLVHQNRPKEAIGHYLRALEIEPNAADFHFNLSFAFGVLGEREQSLRELQTAVRLDPDFMPAHLNLGNELMEKGDVHEAIDQFRQVLRLKPDYADVYSKMLFALHYIDDVSPQQLFDEHLEFASRFVDTIAPLPPASIEREPNKMLRIGYVSPDFCNHPVASFIAPMLAQHDRAAFEIFCYANVPRPDRITERLRGKADHWCDTNRMTDDALARRIRDDRIDILVDLAGHTLNNRLFVFAQKPAPVQVTWIGYPNTTGMRAFDYRIIDAVTDPPETADRFCVERLVRLPGCFLCFEPPTEISDPGEPPVLKADHITFGALSRMAKVSDTNIQLWKLALDAVSDSRLLIKGTGLRPDTASHWLERLTRHGIDTSRVDFAFQTSTPGEYFDFTRRTDIALDSFPYTGATVTCETLWMGVPVVSLSGQTHVSRVGRSLLAACGVADLAAQTREEFVAAILKLAFDIHRLRELRQGLRTQMLQSPLCNAVAFTRDVENAYRQMWHACCARRN